MEKLLTLIPNRWRREIVNVYLHRYSYAARAVSSVHITPIANFLARRIKGNKFTNGSVSARVASAYLVDWKKEDAELSLALAQHFSAHSSRYMQFKIGDRLLRSRIYGINTEKFLKRATLRNFEISVIFRYIDYLSQRYGFRHPDLRRISRRFTRKSFRPYLTRAQKVRAVTVLIKLKDRKSAAAILTFISKEYLDSGAPPLYVQRNLYKMFPGMGFQIPRGSDAYTKLIAYRSAFENQIRLNRDSFCVVGNGPSEIGKGHGELIDSKKMVFRFNNYDLLSPADYGTKETVWVRVPNDESKNDHSFSNEITVLASNNFAAKREYPDKYVLQPYLLGKEFTSVPSSIFNRLIAELGSLPSTGLVILYWIYTIIGPIPRDCIFGFSHLSEMDDFKSHYFEDTLHRRHHQHAWAREIELISRIVK